MNLRKLGVGTASGALALGMLLAPTVSASECDERTTTGNGTEYTDEDGEVHNECMEDPAEGDDATADTTGAPGDRPMDVHVYTEQPSTEDGSGGHIGVQVGTEDDDADGQDTGVGKATLGGSPQAPVLYIEDHTDGDRVASVLREADEASGCRLFGGSVEDGTCGSASDSDAATIRPLAG